ncbi:hypothetical protein [Ideonella oryzae]|uniref:Lipoprotein n=1 Tax=Ideonella oryzae TaxID=2937441 RepID=A0ABT1BLQ1_9BURK|nr:hypothetical protein [Ideonella oryzae]MCO5977151.1 hypothetical protein [Ideonella oryzae]
MRSVLSALAVLVLLSGCDQLGIDTPKVQSEKREAEGKAIGGACRNGGRAIEDCYLLNRKADKAAVYAGWREMDEYMRENKLDAVTPQLKPEDLAKPKPKPDSGGEGGDGSQSTADGGDATTPDKAGARASH